LPKSDPENKVETAPVVRRLLTYDEYPVTAADIIFTKKTREWCGRTYKGKHCPNFGKHKISCPPQVQYNDGILTLYNEFRLMLVRFRYQEYSNEVRPLFAAQNPGLTKKQLDGYSRSNLYWQRTAKETFGDHVMEVLPRPVMIYSCGSGMVINNDCFLCRGTGIINGATCPKCAGDKELQYLTPSMEAIGIHVLGHDPKDPSDEGGMLDFMGIDYEQNPVTVVTFCALACLDPVDDTTIPNALETSPVVKRKPKKKGPSKTTPAPEIESEPESNVTEIAHKKQMTLF
jgi:predicted metal-binding protein